MYKYLLNDTVLERVHEYVDLGVTVDCSLSWDSYVDKTVNEANRILGMIKRRIGFSAPEHAKKQLYVSQGRTERSVNRAWA